MAKARHDIQVDVVANTQQAQQGIYQLSYTLNDLQQFQYGAAAGFRAIGNNIQGTISGITALTAGGKGALAALAGPAGLTLALESRCV